MSNILNGKPDKPLLEKLLEDCSDINGAPENIREDIRKKHARWSRILATFAEDIADDVGSGESLELMVMSVAAAVAYVKAYRKAQNERPAGTKTH